VFCINLPARKGTAEEAFNSGDPYLSMLLGTLLLKIEKERAKKTLPLLV